MTYNFQPCVTMGLDKQMLLGLIAVVEPVKSLIANKMMAVFSECKKSKKTTYSFFPQRVWTAL